MMFLAPSEKEIIACQATTWRLHSRQQYHEASLSTGRRTGMNALTREVHYQLTLGSYNILTMKTWERFTNNSLLHVVNNDCKQDNIFMTDHNASYIMSSTSFKKGYQADNLLHTSKHKDGDNCLTNKHNLLWNMDTVLCYKAFFQLRQQLLYKICNSFSYVDMVTCRMKTFPCRLLSHCGRDKL